MPRTTVIAGLFLALLIVVPGRAMSLKDYNAKSAREQGAIATNFIERMTADIGRTDPQLMRQIRDWFAEGQGPEKLSLEISALDLLAERGKIDISKIEIEGVIVKVIKDRFPPK